MKIRKGDIEIEVSSIEEAAKLLSLLGNTTNNNTTPAPKTLDVQEKDLKWAVLNKQERKIILGMMAIFKVSPHKLPSKDLHNILGGADKDHRGLSGFGKSVSTRIKRCHMNTQDVLYHDYDGWFTCYKFEEFIKSYTGLSVADIEEYLTRK